MFPTERIRTFNTTLIAYIYFAVCIHLLIFKQQTSKSDFNGASEQTWTVTSFWAQWILSPSCLPFHHTRINGCRGWIWTNDFQVMSLASYPTALPCYKRYVFVLLVHTDQAIYFRQDFWYVFGSWCISKPCHLLTAILSVSLHLDKLIKKQDAINYLCSIQLSYLPHVGGRIGFEPMTPSSPNLKVNCCMHPF